jgi:hypothetical protein
MGIGTSTPPTTPAAQPTAQTPGSNLTPQQTQAIAMLLSQMGKNGQMAGGMQGQTPHTQPQTTTVQGGAYFNPNKQ